MPQWRRVMSMAVQKDDFPDATWMCSVIGCHRAEQMADKNPKWIAQNFNKLKILWLAMLTIRTFAHSIIALCFYFCNVGYVSAQVGSFVSLSVSSVMQKVVDDFFLKLFTEVGLVTGNRRGSRSALWQTIVKGDLYLDLDWPCDGKQSRPRGWSERGSGSTLVGNSRGWSGPAPWSKKTGAP